MIRLLKSRRARWALPTVVAAAMAAAAITTTGGAGASERPKLPPKSAAQLLSAVEQAHPEGLTGTIVETAHLGLPDLPTRDAGSGDLSIQSLLTGSHTMRIWYDGPTRQRLAVLAPLSERDVIHNGKDLWTYTSSTNTVTHATVSPRLPTFGPQAIGLTPLRAARQALRAIDPSTTVSVDLTARVAGRAAYQINLVPNDTRSLVHTVRIAIDAATSVPLRVQVFGASKTPAIEVGFTDISFGRPSPSVFDFKAPTGATIDERDRTPAAPGDSPATPEQHVSPPTPARPVTGGGRLDENYPVHLGTGWTTVVEYPGAFEVDGWHGDFLDQLSVAVPGGRLIKTALVTVLVTNSGDVYVGSVNGADLQRVAATGHGL